MMSYCGHDIPFTPDNPGVFVDSLNMSGQAVKVRESSGGVMCFVPFCCTVEAEAFGADVNFGDGLSVPGVSGHLWDSFAEMSEGLKGINFESGRIHEVIKACGILHGMGEKVCVEIGGAMTIFNGLIELPQLFRAWRKDRDSVKNVLAVIADELMKYMTRLKDSGADVLSFADSSASLDILGGKFSRMMCEDFFVPFLKRAGTLADDKTIIHICPRNSHMLEALGYAETREYFTRNGIHYDEACIESAGHVKMTGQACIKNRSLTLRDGIIREIIIHE